MVKKIFLGDQSPWNGGWLRVDAARELLKTEKDMEIVYMRQDVDPPWVPSAQPGTDVRQREGFIKYASVATRVPWTLETPRVRLTDPLQSMSLRSGFQYLVGPPTNRTLWGFRQDSVYRDVFHGLLRTDAEHAARLKRIITNESYGGSMKIVEQQLDTVSDTCRQELSLVEYFREKKPELLGTLPAAQFWEVEPEEGRRVTFSGQVDPSRTYVPKGIALILELSVRGFAVGHSNLPYLSEVMRLRDAFLPDHPVSLCRIAFDWHPHQDPLPPLLSEWNRKRERAGRKSGWVNKGDLQLIYEYWRRHPTFISLDILGGDVRPSLTWETC